MEQKTMQLLDVKQAAEVLRVSEWTIRAWVRAKKLKPVRLGRLVRLDEQELQEFIGAAKRGRGSDGQVEMKGEN